MQRQISAIDSFPETIDIDQRSVSSDTGMSQQTSLNNLPNPVESRLSNNAVSSGEASCVNAISNDVQSFNGWSSGESSSRLSLQNQVNDDGIKMEERWPSSVNVDAVAGPRSEERRFEPTNILFPGRVSVGVSSNQIRSGPLFLQGSSSNHVPPNLNPNARYMGDSANGGHITGAVLGPNCFNSSGLEIEQASLSSVSSVDDVGTSSGSSSYMVEGTNAGSGSSLGGWGLSCKRKALEGTSGQSCPGDPGGSSSCFPQAENAAWHTGPTRHNASSSLSLSAPSRNSSSVSPAEQLNPRIGFGMRGVASDSFPSSVVAGNADPLRNFGRRANPGQQQESVTFNLSTTGGSRRSHVWSPQPSPRPVPFSDSLDLRSTAAAATNSSAAQGQPHVMHTSAFSRNIHSFPWSGSNNSRAGNPSSSLNPGERGAALREEVNFRSIPRNNAEHPMFAPATEMRNMTQDPTGWSLFTGNMSTSGNVPPTRIGSNSSVHPFPTPAWIPHHNPTAHNQQRFSEFAPWSLFPSGESESGGHSGHFPPPSSGLSASPQETVMSSGSSSQGHNQPFPRSAFFVEGQGDDVLGMPRSLRALAADIEGRHRLISEVCITYIYFCFSTLLLVRIYYLKAITLVWYFLI